MMTRDQIQTVLDALNEVQTCSDPDHKWERTSLAITILQAALAEPSEPVDTVQNTVLR